MSLVQTVVRATMKGKWRWRIEGDGLMKVVDDRKEIKLTEQTGLLSRAQARWEPQKWVLIILYYMYWVR